MINYEFNQLSTSFVPNFIKQYWESNEAAGFIDISIKKDKKTKKEQSLDLKGGCTTILCKQHRTDSDYLCFCGINDTDLPMVLCDYCDIWYHFGCVEENPSVSSKEIYVCPICNQWIAYAKSTAQKGGAANYEILPKISNIRYKLPQILLTYLFWNYRQNQAINNLASLAQLKTQLTDLLSIPLKSPSQIEKIIQKLTNAFNKDEAVQAQTLNAESTGVVLKEYENDIKVSSNIYKQLKKQWGIYEINKLAELYNTEESKDKISEILEKLKSDENMEQSDIIKSIKWIEHCSIATKDLFDVKELMKVCNITPENAHFANYSIIKALVNEVNFIPTGIANLLFRNLLYIIWLHKTIKRPYTQKKIQWLYEQAKKYGFSSEAAQTINEEFNRYSQWMQAHSNYKKQVFTSNVLEIEQHIKESDKLNVNIQSEVIEEQQWLEWIKVYQKLHSIQASKISYEDAQILLKEAETLDFPKEDAAYLAFQNDLKIYSEISNNHSTKPGEDNKITEEQANQIISSLNKCCITSTELITFYQSELDELNRYREEILHNSELDPKQIKNKLKSLPIIDAKLLSEIKAKKWMKVYNEEVNGKDGIKCLTINKLFFSLKKVGTDISQQAKQEIELFRQGLDKYFEVIKSIKAAGERIPLQKFIIAKSSAPMRLDLSDYTSSIDEIQKQIDEIYALHKAVQTKKSSIAEYNKLLEMCVKCKIVIEEIEEPTINTVNQYALFKSSLTGMVKALKDKKSCIEYEEASTLIKKYSTFPVTIEAGELLKSKFEESESAFQYCKDMLAKCDDNTTLDEIISLSQKFIGIEFKFEGMEDISKEICLLKLKYFADEFNSTASSNKFDFSAVQSVSLDGIAYADDPVAKKHLSIIDKSLAEAKEDIRRINQAMILASIEELEAELAKKKIDLTSEIEERKIKIKADVEIRKRKNPDPMPEWLFKNREKRSIKTTEHSDFIYDDVIISPKKKKEEVKKQTQHQPQKKQPQQSKGINPNIRKKNSATLEEILSKSDLMKSSNRVNQFANEAENYAFGKHQNDEKEYNALMDKIIENMEIIAKSSNLSNKVVSGKHSIAKLCSLNKEKLIKAKDVVKKPQEGLSITKVIEGLQQLEQITKKKEKETEAAKEGVEKPFIASKMEVVTNILNPNKNDDESLESLSPANAKFSDDEKKSNIKEARDVLIKSGKKLYDLNSAIEPEEKYDPSMCYKIEKGKKKKNVAPENKIYLQYEPGYKLEPLNVAEPETILKVVR